MAAGDDRDELAEVVQLSSRRVDGPDGGEVVDAELVEDDYETRQREAAYRRWEAYKQDVVVAARAVKFVVTHSRTRRAAKAVARHLSYVLAGALLLLKRLWEAKTNSLHQRQLRAAEAAGDLDRLLEWESRSEAAKERRHRRAMNWLAAPVRLVKALVTGVAAVAGVLLALGIVLAVVGKDSGLVLGPIGGLVDLLGWVAWVVATYTTVVLVAVTAGVIAVFWQVGRAAGVAPQWAMPAEQNAAQGGALVTADAIVTALRHLGVPTLNKAFKDGWVPRFELPPTREGQGQFKGYRAIVDLPMGVTPGMIADRREVLAKNLHRIPVEVWPADYGQQKGGRAGFLNLYVADAGVMDRPTPDYPLLHEGTADVFEGVPEGIDQRGGLITFPLLGSNFVFGGQPGQGKSNAALVVMLGAALDPLCELRVHVFALNGDFDAYERRLTLYEKGATPEHAALATEHLYELKEEVGRREGRLAELGAKKLTRTLAEKYPDLRPIVALFSECHELFGDKESGEIAGELAVDVIKRGRKTDIVLGFDTQSSRANAIPPQIVENIGVNGCFSVKSWRSNDGFLGDGSFAAGIRATDLRFNVDRGTMVATGASEQLFELVRTFYIVVDDDTGFDAAAEVIERALAQMAAGTPAGDRGLVAAITEGRDLLADVAEVLVGHDAVKATDVCARLRKLAPGHSAYAGLTAEGLAEALADEGVAVRKKDGVLTVRARLVQAALADREE